MATWSELVDFVRSNYTIADEKPGFIKLVFETGGLRSQLVFISQHALKDGEEEWAIIESPFAEVGSVDLQRALEEIGGMVCGGVAVTAGFTTVRHSVPLQNLDINEFVRPLILVTITADELEKKFVGGDKF
jgi:hypothetical protein